jgi:hypothetical protein
MSDFEKTLINAVGAFILYVLLPGLILIALGRLLAYV